MRLTRKKQSVIHILIIVTMIACAFIVQWMANSLTAKAAEYPTYTVTTSSTPYQNQYIKYSTYNDKTKHYYVLRSYLEKIEKTGGGTLILSKGTYVVTNTLYVPSNVTIYLKDGVKLVKGNDTGTTKIAPSKSLFQLVTPSKQSKSGSAVKYDGESGIIIKGKGTAVIDLNYVKGATAIVIGHNSNVTVKGITFKKMYDGSFIRVGASKNINIRNNTFRYYKASATGSREAVALEVPDSATKTFSYPWSKEDKTVNSDITIEGNVFKQLERAIGSAKYTSGKYQTNIQIVGNTLSNIRSSAIRVLNWKDCVIQDNHFTSIQNTSGTLKVVLVSGAKNPSITGNTFTDVDRIIQIMPWKNSNYGNSYAITYNEISDVNKAAILENTVVNASEYLIRYNKTYNEFTKNTEKWMIYDKTVNSFLVQPDSEPFQNLYTTYSTYNSDTKQYYMVRSYLEQLERLGGGTLTLKAGTYQICNTLYVPSNTTLKFEDGVIMKKTEQTSVEDLNTAKSLFQLITPSKSTTEGVYGGYNGDTNISFVGQGTVIFDLDYIQDSIAIVIGHNTNIKISGINFQNMYSGHFIELDASNNVTIENNSFRNHKASASGIKEAINLDTPDVTTKGFNVIWSNHDCTPNKNVIIQNNTFEDLERAIGTHKYSGDKYHENVQILNNKIYKTDSDAIRILNWKNPVITGNRIELVADGQDNNRAILASGIINPTITGNTFVDAARPIQIFPWKNEGDGSQYAITYNVISSDNITAMLKNDLVRVQETFIRINHKYDVYDTDTDKYYYSGEYVSY